MIASLVLLAALTTPPAPQALPTISVQAPRATLTLQVAKTDEQRERGLMDVTKLPTHTGMVFVFDQDAPVEFWMKNTLIPLDMVFIGGDGRVRSVAESVPSSTLETPDDKIARRSGRAKFVIELPAEEAEHDGLIAGAYVAGLSAVHAKDP